MFKQISSTNTHEGSKNEKSMTLGALFTNVIELGFLWDVIIHLYSNLRCSLMWPPLKIGHEFITSHCFMCVFTHPKSSPVVKLLGNLLFLVCFRRLPPLPPLGQHFSTLRENHWSSFLQTTHGWPMDMGNFFSTHLGGLGSRSLSYQSGTHLNLSPP